MSNVFREMILNQDDEKTANVAFAKEHARIFGNKRCVVVLESQPDATTGDVVFTLSSQINEKGVAVKLFTYDAATNLLMPTADITNVLELKFHHTITYEGDNSSGGNNDANDNMSVYQKVVDTDGGLTVEWELDRINSALNLGDGEFFSKKIVEEPEPLPDPTSTRGINSLIGLGWTLKEFGNPVIKCSALKVTIGINYFDANEQGGQ